MGVERGDKKKTHWGKEAKTRAPLSRGKRPTKEAGPVRGGGLKGKRQASGLAALFGCGAEQCLKKLCPPNQNNFYSKGFNTVTPQP